MKKQTKAILKTLVQFIIYPVAIIAIMLLCFKFPLLAFVIPCAILLGVIFYIVYLDNLNDIDKKETLARGEKWYY